MHLKPIQTVLALTLTAVIASSVMVATPAHAIKGDHARFHTCKKLEAAGTVKWHGIATGTVEDVFAVNPRNRTFHVRACFTTQKACRTWVKRIWWEIPTMDELHNAWCRKL